MPTSATPPIFLQGYSLTFNGAVGEPFSCSVTVDLKAESGDGISAQCSIPVGGYSTPPPGINVGVPGGVSGLKTFTFGGTPTQVGTATVLLRATNQRGTTDFYCTISIAEFGGGSTFSINDANATAQVGKPFIFHPTTVGTPPTHEINSWLIEPLPGGLVADPVTGAITGVPTTAGVYNIQMSPLYTPPGGGLVSGYGTALLVLTVQAVESADDSHVHIEINLGDGVATVVNGVPLAYYGDQKYLKVRFTPAANAANVTNVRLTLKEKSEVLQYLALLAATAPASTTPDFSFPLLTFAGDDLRDSLLLYDESTPSTQVVYSLEIFFDWGGRARKSGYLDFIVIRPQDMDFAVAGVVIPGSTTPPPQPGGLIRYSPNGTGFSIDVDDLGNLTTTPI